MAGLTAVGYFLLSLLFTIVIFSLWLRIAIRFFRISAINPFSQLIHTITDPLVKPLYWIIKKPLQPGQKYDWIAFGVLILVEFFKIISLSLLIYHAIIPFLFIFLYILVDLIIQPCEILFFAVLIRVIMSYVNPKWQHPLGDFLRVITTPILRLGRIIVPDISGFDFSPFIIMVILKIITLFLSASLPWKLL
ncbi:TPA: YggT family protein [Legionella pneumophila]|uniref:YggT family protein n=1 Tax=Legionella pneumophila TaxID=446 RepID=A0AAN5Q427_LEGPN|nr:YggT family protein [Legionella pneumophila]TIH04415.1 YggT family protein [Legionella pneumophila]HAT2137746.1 YggT family protein [Legionella pneumophila]HAT2148998.1 YggT family protein [Legionella pneumophila]HAT2152130.1 YggT family protein [Legionella pneumophila]HAT3857546.1 YggT family protein [Legionella pneumophila]